VKNFFIKHLKTKIKDVRRWFIYFILVFLYAICICLRLFPFHNTLTVFLYFYFQKFIYESFSIVLNMEIYYSFLVLVALMVFTILKFLNKFMIKRLLIVILIGVFLIGELIIPSIILQPTKAKMENAISKLNSLLNTNNSVEDLVRNIIYFVNSEVKASYNRPESAFKIDILLTPFDYYLLGICGFERSHVILFQGWGSCEQYAKVTEYLLSRLGFNVRYARFKDIDHGWTEVHINGTWFIIDPWYIAHYFKDSILIPAEKLSSISVFHNSRGVIVCYLNGTQKDASLEHGYVEEN